MGRPPLPLGTYGKIRTVRVGPSTFRARANYRDYDGVTRPVERVGPSRVAAENNLKSALRDRGRVVRDGEITPDTKVSAVAELWLRDLTESSKAARTKATYQEVWTKLLAAPTGQLRVRDLSRVSTVDRIIRAIRDHNGPGRAKHARVVLSGICGLAVRHDAMDTNPVRDLTPAPRKRRTPRKMVLTVASVGRLRAHLHDSDHAAQHDLVDLVDVLSGLGCRIGELLALDWAKLDFAAGTVAIEATVIRIPGQGLIVQPHTKSEAGMRTITPPQWLMDILKRRLADSSSRWVFPSSTDTLRDPDNTRKQLRTAVGGTEWEGLHPHAFRHFVATRLDAAGWTAREIADYLGHDRISMTQDEYMDRHVAGRGSTTALPEIPPQTRGKDEG